MHMLPIAGQKAGPIRLTFKKFKIFLKFFFLFLRVVVNKYKVVSSVFLSVCSPDHNSGTPGLVCLNF